MTRTLIILRHAKSDWSTGLADHERPLNARGRRDAVAAGEALAEIGTIDRVLSSTSARTRETWARAMRGGAEAREVEFHDALYLSSPATMLGLLQELPDAVGSAMILAHFPGVLQAVETFAVRDGHPGWVSIDEKYPTSGLAVLEFEGSWSELAPGAARLVDWRIPRG